MVEVRTTETPQARSRELKELKKNIEISETARLTRALSQRILCPHAPPGILRYGQQSQSPEPGALSWRGALLHLADAYSIPVISSCSLNRIQFILKGELCSC